MSVIRLQTQNNHNRSARWRTAIPCASVHTPITSIKHLSRIHTCSQFLLCILYLHYTRGVHYFYATVLLQLVNSRILLIRSFSILGTRRISHGTRDLHVRLTLLPQWRQRRRVFHISIHRNSVRSLTSFDIDSLNVNGQCDDYENMHQRTTTLNEWCHCLNIDFCYVVCWEEYSQWLLPFVAHWKIAGVSLTGE